MERERYKKVPEEKIFQLEARVKELGGKAGEPPHDQNRQKNKFLLQHQLHLRNQRWKSSAVRLKKSMRLQRFLR